MRRTLLFFASLAITLAPFAQAAPAATENGAPIRRREFLSPVYTIEKIYKSMEGPYDQQPITIEPDAKPELLWLKSVRVDIVGEDGKTPAPSEFMCHMNLDLDSSKHQHLLALPYTPATRIVTLSQGVFDAKVPAGYGFPIVSSEPLNVFTQVLNHNVKEPNHRKVRHLVTIEYVRDAELKTPMKALANVGASGLVLDQPKPDLFKSMDAMPGMDHSSMAMDHSAMTTTAASPATVAAMSSSTASASSTGSPSTDATSSTVASAAHSSSTTVAATSGPEGIHHAGLTCLIGARAPNANGGEYTDPQGHHLLGHWVVPPGKQVNRSDATWFMALPFDGKLHMALAHLHPYAQSLTLRDTTTGTDIFKAVAKNPAKGIGLAHVDTLESDAGIPMYRDHKYEIISVYDNPTQTNADSMASVFLGIDDPQFQKPTPTQIATRASDLLDVNASVVVIRTAAGDVAAELYRDQSPAATKQFFRLLRAGAFDHATFDRVDRHRGLVASPGALSSEVAALAYAPFEDTMPNRPGALSFCPGDASFSIVISAIQSLNGHCTAFGMLGPGAAVIRSMTDAPRKADGTLVTPIAIQKIELIEGRMLAGITLAPPPATPTAATTPVASLK
jgi:cyclophilin family peptidyl-prolyl cis-trans isomerase